jgi:hypothetical protein
MKSPGWRHEGLVAFSEAVAVWWRRWRGPARRLGDLCHRLFLIVGYSWVAISIQLPIISDYLSLKNVLVCLAAVILTGKAVYDTLFYDHYHP